jgi:hypothetical protein
LAIQCSHAPSLGNSLTGVPLASGGVGDAHQRLEMRPPPIRSTVWSEFRHWGMSNRTDGNCADFAPQSPCQNQQLDVQLNLSTYVLHTPPSLAHLARVTRSTGRSANRPGPSLD